AHLMRLALLRVHVTLLARYVEVAREHQLAAVAPQLLRPRRHLPQELELAGIVATAVGHVDRGEHEVAGASGDDATLAIERRMLERRLLGEARTRQRQRDSRVRTRAVPETPVIRQRAQRLRQLLAARLELLQHDDVGPLALQPLEQLRLACAHAVDVPGRDLEPAHSRQDTALRRRLAAPRRELAPHHLGADDMASTIGWGFCAILARQTSHPLAIGGDSETPPSPLRSLRIVPILPGVMFAAPLPSIHDR